MNLTANFLTGNRPSLTCIYLMGKEALQLGTNIALGESLMERYVLGCLLWDKTGVVRCMFSLGFLEQVHSHPWSSLTMSFKIQKNIQLLQLVCVCVNTLNSSKSVHAERV